MKIKLPEKFEWDGMKSICYNCKTNIELDITDRPDFFFDYSYDHTITIKKFVIKCPTCGHNIYFCDDEKEKELAEYDKKYFNSMSYKLGL